MRKTAARPRLMLPVVACLALVPCSSAIGEEPASDTAAAQPSAPPAPGAMMLDLLPRRTKQAACFSGTFSGQAIEVEDWRKPGLEIVPGVFRFGEPVKRPVPVKLPDQAVTAMTLSLTYDDRKSEYDWIYNFILMATMADGSRRLFAAGECPWYAIPHTQDTGEVWPASTTKLGCYIDCDGGGMGLERIAGSPAVNLHFDNSASGLRMSLGCGGGGGLFRLGTGEADNKVLFRLERTKASACKPLVKWLKHN